MATTKRTTVKKEDVKVETVNTNAATSAESTTHGTAEEAKPKVKTPAMTDLVLCRSLTVGTLLMTGTKSNMPYCWEDIGDECEVEYQDLLALLSKKSPYLYSPLFVIEDTEILDIPRWASLKELYKNLYDISDIDKVLNLPEAKFRKILSAKNTPEGLKDAIKLTVASRYEEGTFDSLKKLKALDEILGTDFLCSEI